MSEPKTKAKKTTTKTSSKTKAAKNASVGKKPTKKAEAFHPDLVTFLIAVVAGLIITMVGVMIGWLKF